MQALSSLIGEVADPDALIAQSFHHLGRFEEWVRVKLKAHGPAARPFSRGITPGRSLSCCQSRSLRRRSVPAAALVLPPVPADSAKNAVLPSRNATGSHFETTAVGVERMGIVEGRSSFIAQAPPADQGWVGFQKHSLREGYTAKPSGPQAHLWLKGIDVCGSGSFIHWNLAHALGGIHQQKRFGRVLLKLGGDRRDASAAPYSRAESSTTGQVLGEHLLKGFQHCGVGLRLFVAPAPQLTHRQNGHAELLPACQFQAGRHHTRMFAVADEKVIASRIGSPQSGNAAARNVFTQSQTMRGTPQIRASCARVLFTSALT